MKLSEPLGQWYKGHVQQTWNTVLDPNNKNVYIWDQGCVCIYERQGRSQKCYQYIKPHRTNSFPIGCIPVTGNFQAGQFIIDGSLSFTHSPISMNPATNDRQLMLRGTQHTTPLHIATQSLWDGQAILATDGSVKDDIATYAWVLSMTNDTIGPDIKGGGLLPPSAPYANYASKRPEAAALYAALQWIDLILAKYPDTTNSTGESPPLPIPIDNKSVIDNIHRPIDTTTPIFNTMTPDYDIIQAIRKIIPNLPIQLDIFHIKGHQDHTKAFEDLSPYAQLNVLADQHAEQLHHTPATHIGMIPQWTPGTEVALFHGNLQITSHISDYIRTAKHAPTMKTYLIEQSQMASGRDLKWTADIYDNIAWRHMGENLRQLSIGQRIQIAKYMNDLLPTAKRLQTFNNEHDGRCFECQQLWEDTNHILQCPGEDRSNQRKESMQTLCLQLNARKLPIL